jgi:hypothetical protein
MINMLTAYTEEIDDVEVAISEILVQLDLQNRLLKNSVGILHCYYEFLESGVVRGLCAQLPFDVVGATTMSLSVPGAMGDMGLSVTVLTSSDIRFVTGISEPVADAPDPPLEGLGRQLFSEGAEKPALLIPYVPFLTNCGGDAFIAKIDELSGGIPAFGTLSITNEAKFAQTYTIYNGEGYPASLVLLALYGDVNPVFFTASIPEEEALERRGVISAAKGNVLYKVNDLSAVEYLESLGIVAKDDDISGFIVLIPLVVYLPDGSRLVRTVLAPGENGSLVLSGNVPVNVDLNFSFMEPEAILTSTGEKLKEYLPVAQGRNLLLYSCCSRNWALGMKGMEEHVKAGEILGNAIPYQCVYSGGEIFPSVLEDGKIVNHLQNFSLIACVL